jgi:DNA-directed RNA polymerase specialized sigma subunit
MGRPLTAIMDEATNLRPAPGRTGLRELSSGPILVDGDAEELRRERMANELDHRVRARYGVRVTAGEERGAISAYQAGAKAAGRLLCEAHEGFLRSIVRPWRRVCAPDDLLQEARTELLRSARDFDLATYDNRLLTFAGPRVSAAVRRYARANAGSVATPKHEALAADVPWDDWKYSRIAEAPTEQELCMAIDVRAEVRRTKRRRAEVLTLRLQGLNHEEVGAALGISKQRSAQLEQDGWWPVAPGDLRDDRDLSVGSKHGDLTVRSKTTAAEHHNGESQYVCRCTCGRITVELRSRIVRGPRCRHETTDRTTDK